GRIHEAVETDAGALVDAGRHDLELVLLLETAQRDPAGCDVRTIDLTAVEPNVLDRVGDQVDERVRADLGRAEAHAGAAGISPPGSGQVQLDFVGDVRQQRGAARSLVTGQWMVAGHAQPRLGATKGSLASLVRRAVHRRPGAWSPGPRGRGFQRENAANPLGVKLSRSLISTPRSLIVISESPV